MILTGEAGRRGCARDGDDCERTHPVLLLGGQVREQDRESLDTPLPVKLNEHHLHSTRLGFGYVKTRPTGRLKAEGCCVMIIKRGHAARGVACRGPRERAPWCRRT